LPFRRRTRAHAFNVIAERMANPKAPIPLDEIELYPDGWERFERAVDGAIKASPQSRAEIAEATRRAKVEAKANRS